MPCFLRPWAGLVALTAFALACGGGGDGDPEVQGYVDAVGQIFEGANAERLALDQELPAPGPQSEAGDARQWFDRVIQTQERTIGALRAVGDPPVAVREAHDRFLAAESELLAINRRIRDRLAAAGPDFDMPGLANDLELGVTPHRRVGERAVQACQELEGAARGGGVEADFECGSTQ